MKIRVEHCAFKRLNRNGKCIADCIYNRQEGYDRDCIGRSGKTIEPRPEVQVQGGH